MSTFPEILTLVALTAYFVGEAFYVYAFAKGDADKDSWAVKIVLGGGILHTVAVVLGVAKMTSWTNISPRASLNIFSWIIILVFLILRRKFSLDALGSFLMPIPLGAGLYGFFMGSEDFVVLEMMRGPLLTIHILSALFGYASFVFVFGLAIMYLLQERALKHRTPNWFYYQLPPLQVLDRLAQRSLVIGFPLVTFSILSGAIMWAHVPPGTVFTFTLWNKEVWAVFSWGIFAMLLITRHFYGWRGAKGAYIAIAGFCATIITLVGALNGFSYITA